MLEHKNLTVGEAIKTLQGYDPNLILCIENGGFAPKQTTVVMSELGWISGEFAITKSHRIHKEYIMPDEIPPAKASDYMKVLVINAMTTKDEK